MLTPRRYLAIAAAAALTCMVTLIAWNAWFDLYADRCYLTGLCNDPVISTRKQSEEKLKAVLLRQIATHQPDAVIVGSSRATIMDPRRPAFANATGKGLNLAFPGATVDCLIPVIEGVRAQSPDTLMIIALDFYAFSARAEFDCLYVLPERRVAAIANALLRLASLATAYDNFRYAAGIGAGTPSMLINATGGRTARATYDRATRHAQIADTINFYVRTPGWYQDFEYDPAAMAALARSVQGARAVFFVSPISVWHHEALERTGLVDDFSAWKAQIARLGHVLDFSETHEIVANVDNYTDSSHYTAPIADLIVEDVSRYLAGGPVRHAKTPPVRPD